VRTAAAAPLRHSRRHRGAKPKPDAGWNGRRRGRRRLVRVDKRPFGYSGWKLAFDSDVPESQKKMILVEKKRARVPANSYLTANLRSSKVASGLGH
jgi:hypothetical protein